LNLRIGSNWMGTRIARMGLIYEQRWDMHTFRHKSPVLTMDKGGWHFGFMGGAERVKKKIESYMHVEFDLPQFTDVDKIAERMKAGKDPFDRQMPLDESRNKVVSLEMMPAYVRENPHLFVQWLKPTIEVSA
jgi:beta-1,4-mannosyl-glycoprotein beta-1,4-N-acetylglucosaminyltransferase